MKPIACSLFAALSLTAANLSAGVAALPPMGWNSYDAYGDSVTEAETLTNAAWMNTHLRAFGWDTIVVDFRWYDALADGLRVQNPEGVMIDSFGRCVPATNRFPSAVKGAGFKPLADKLHAMGLKFGIHIMRGIPRRAVEQNLPIANSPFHAADAVLPLGDTNRTCVWNRDMFGVDAKSAAGRAWYESIARQYAGWNVDYIKCDDIANLQRGIIYDAPEIEALSTALQQTGRPIALSISPGETPVNCGPHLRKFVNLWRISGDFWDRWSCVDHNFDLFGAWLPDAGPGHWPDGDMIPLGHICLRNCDVHPDRWTRLTRAEQVTLMTLLAIAPSPLMLGMNLPDNDAWTTSLLTNTEVLAVNQDPLGRAARRMTGPPVAAETWMKTLSDGSCAIGLFNRSNQTAHVHFPWRNLGFTSAPEVRDLWLRQTLARAEEYAQDLPPHGSVLLRVK
ncbi:MAG TPA: alpha-galactosidase [Verrucomicrobiae bacterium]|nr:alpha-galactosidase [Verrucomicrobiae bacterium]